MEKLESEFSSIRNSMQIAEKEHDAYLQKLQDLHRVQDKELKSTKQVAQAIAGLKDILTKAELEAKTDEDREKIEEIKRELTYSRQKLKEMQSELPVQNNGFYLSLILGHNLNLSLLSNDQRYKYKQDYEQFKWRVTVTMLAWTLISYFLPLRVVDSMGNFLMVWYYCTLTIRESILTINGSKIKGWWVMHHYISTVLSGVVLIWRDGECYQLFRTQFLVFVAYICIVQLMQNQYQSGCLRRLHSLGQGHQMDVTVEGFTGWMFKGLTFLLPFLIFGYIFQLYNAYTLWTLSPKCDGQWQVDVLCYLFLFIALGNIYTTSLVVFRKFRSSGTYDNLLKLTRKYRIRMRSKKE